MPSKYQIFAAANVVLPSAAGSSELASLEKVVRKPREEIRSHTALRGVAALAVLLGHLPALSLFPESRPLFYVSQLFSWKVEAVYLFFILSGFILSFVYGGSAIRWRDFYVARFARIYPAYLGSLMLSWGFSVLSSTLRHLPSSVSPGQFLANLLMIQSWPFVFQESINLSAWSLSVEVFLYVVVFPTLIVTARRHTLFFAALTLPAVMAAMWLQYDSGPRLESIPGAFAVEGCCGFLIGFVIYRCFPDGVRSPLANFGSFLSVGAAFLAFFDVLPKVSLAVILPCVVALTIDQRAVLSQLLSHKWLVFLGEISYSVYIWHWPIIRGLMHPWGIRSLGGLTTSPMSPLFCKVGYLGSSILIPLVIGTISYFFLELPLRKRLRAVLTSRRVPRVPRCP